MLAKDDHLPATIKEHLKRLTFAGVCFGCGDGLALKLSSAWQLGELFQRGPEQHLQPGGICVAMHLPSAHLSGVQPQGEGGCTVKVKGQQRAGEHACSCTY